MFVAILSGILFVVATCMIRKRERLANANGVPANLSDFGPIVSCEDDDSDLHQFLNKSRDASECEFDSDIDNEDTNDESVTSLIHRSDGFVPVSAAHPNTMSRGGFVPVSAAHPNTMSGGGFVPVSAAHPNTLSGGGFVNTLSAADPNTMSGDGSNNTVPETDLITLNVGGYVNTLSAADPNNMSLV